MNAQDRTEALIADAEETLTHLHAENAGASDIEIFDRLFVMLRELAAKEPIGLV